MNDGDDVHAAITEFSRARTPAAPGFVRRAIPTDDPESMNEGESMVVLGTIDLTKQFKVPGHKPIQVLKGVNLSVHAGEKVAIIGRSGAGKSTLLNLLGGLEKPTSGTVTRPKNLGFVFQQYHLMPELTVLENVVLPSAARRLREYADGATRRAKELLAKVGLADRMHHLPGELSGGEMQRVALARALVTDPEAILADEPTGNLDAWTGAGILKMLTELSGDREVALVMVTHSPDAARICDRVLKLENGVLTVDNGVVVQ